MAELKKEYTDIKDVKHKVEHIVLPSDSSVKERTYEELVIALTKTQKHKSA